jgi:hypothetical protein
MRSTTALHAPSTAPRKRFRCLLAVAPSTSPVARLTLSELSFAPLRLRRPARGMAYDSLSGSEYALFMEAIEFIEAMEAMESTLAMPAGVHQQSSTAVQHASVCK